MVIRSTLQLLESTTGCVYCWFVIFEQQKVDRRKWVITHLSFHGSAPGVKRSIRVAAAGKAVNKMMIMMQPGILF